MLSIFFIREVIVMKMKISMLNKIFNNNTNNNLILTMTAKSLRNNNIANIKNNIINNTKHVYWHLKCVGFTHMTEIGK